MPKLLKILLIICAFSLSVLAQQQKEEIKNEPIKLLSKPSASYTLRAKKDFIEGNVRLKITFQFDGKIGNITDATEKDKEKLAEYGLTANAMEAARKIKFVPAKRDGKFITVTKVVVYQFTLF